MEELLEQIERADDIQISRIIQSVIRRYGRVHPDHEVVFLALPIHNPEERKAVLNGALRILGMEEA